MSGIASSLASPPKYRNHLPPRPRSEAKRARIIDTAMRHFAEQGYHAARVCDVTGIACSTNGWKVTFTFLVSLGASIRFVGVP